MIKWKCSKKDRELIDAIVTRALRLAKAADIKTDRQSLSMDITACHRNGCPLDLVRLLSADDMNLGHDVFGIRRYIDHDTGKLTDCFVPRTSKLRNTKADKFIAAYRAKQAASGAAVASAR